MENDLPKKRVRSQTLTRYEMHEYAHKIVFFVAIANFISAISIAALLWVGVNYIVLNDHSIAIEANIPKLKNQLDTLDDMSVKAISRLASIEDKLRLILTTKDGVSEPKVKEKYRAK